jgi:hypothetical protein
MRPGWNPARRNRNAGTKAHGHGVDNEFSIPESWNDSKCYWERLSSYTVVTRPVGAREVRFFVEPTRPDWFYPCTVDDICAVLAHCSADVLDAFDFIVLRQPTRKQRILCPVWGRAIFVFDMDRYQGRAIVIEAQDLTPIDWSESVDPERARELERLRRDGHGIHRIRKGIQIRVTPTSLRNTVLYRTLFHEIGHHVDHDRSCVSDWEGKTRATKEDYAHRFAQELHDRLAALGALPFAPIIDERSLLADGLQQEWFCLP